MTESVTRLALPHHDHLPPQRLQGRAVLRIPLSVACDLGRPELGVRLRDAVRLASLMSVPEAAVHEDHGLVLRKGDVGPTGQVLAMQTEAVARRMKLLPHQDLRLGVLPQDPSHDLGALLCCEDIHTPKMVNGS